ncbi:MAG TPA: molybdopterin molybdenumtransferase MoeA, partial [Spirochaetes bacterium]|nr:molybdopterin molybdenumtransferase MoeA [Spirochaetota bacterium]
MISVEKALEIILNNVTGLPEERVPVFEAAGRFLSEDIVAGENIPPVDNSAMDGYAVIAADTRDATADNPRELRITEEVRAGGSAQGIRAEAGLAVRIMTGAPVPAGADAVIQFEDTRERGNRLEIYRQVGEGENIRRAGEDVSRGSTVLHPGRRLGSAEMGLLASLNYGEVRVYRRPRVAVISTGDEVAEVGEPLQEGHIRNSNAYTLYG